MEKLYEVGIFEISELSLVSMHALVFLSFINLTSTFCPYPFSIISVQLKDPPRGRGRRAGGGRRGGRDDIGIFFIQTRLYVNTSTRHNIATFGMGLHDTEVIFFS